MITSANPRTGQSIATTAGATTADVARAASDAAVASAAWAQTPAAVRADVIDAIAGALEAARGALVSTADAETGLGEARFNGELDRTTGQLRAFAALVREGSFVDAIISSADPESKPAPRPDIRRMMAPLGPVAVFTPCNFPLAFGVAGGDTASALAAGCAVVVKGHPSHPGTSDLCARVVTEAARQAGAPDHLLSLVQTSAPDVSRALVEAPEIQAVAFTGSLGVGRLLFDVAARRAQPIPFYGELGSVNPVFVGTAAAAARGEAIADGFAASMTMGTGQFCTKPGILCLPPGDAGDRLLDRVGAQLAVRDPGPLLNAGLRASLDTKIQRTARANGVREVTSARAVPDAGFFAAPRLFVTDAVAFIADPALADEHFGPVSIVIRVEPAAMAGLAERLGGQLTATLHADAADRPWAEALLAVVARHAGRVVWNGFPTGVAVVPAMQHGGPYPSSTAPLHTSVGTTAIRRFLRPVAYQNVPDALLPAALQAANPLGIDRLVDGVRTRA